MTLNDSHVHIWRGLLDKTVQNSFIRYQFLLVERRCFYRKQTRHLTETPRHECRQLSFRRIVTQMHYGIGPIPDRPLPFRRGDGLIWTRKPVRIVGLSWLFRC